MDAPEDSSVNFDTCAHRHDRCQQQDSKNLFCPSPLAELHENAIAPICWPFQLTNPLSSDESPHPSRVSPTELEAEKVSQPQH